MRILASLAGPVEGAPGEAAPEGAVATAEPVVTPEDLVEKIVDDSAGETKAKDATDSADEPKEE